MAYHIAAALEEMFRSKQGGAAACNININRLSPDR